MTLKLPWCEYPTSADTTLHGLFDLTEDLPVVDFTSGSEYRNDRFKPVRVRTLDTTQTLETARVVARSFAINEPMNRHIRPSKQVPESITKVTYRDAWGNDPFGPWTTENIFFWFVRLLLLGNPSDPLDRIDRNEDLLDHSFAMVNDGRITGGCFNITLPYEDEAPREKDPFLEAIFSHYGPIVNFLQMAEQKAMDALKKKYPAFRKALKLGKVGSIYMIARSNELSSEHTFGLFATSCEHFREQGYEYIIISATNQWTGAACEVLSGVRVYFSPFRNLKRIATEYEAAENEPYSQDGFIAGKDSGVMIYTMKLR